MYKDFKGYVIVDTVEHITTINEYAQLYNIDINLFEVLSIEIGGFKENISSKFVCKNKVDGEIVEFPIKPYTKVFEEFFKTTKIVIENK